MSARRPITVRSLGQWLRHHASALIATLADYLVMVICVELLGFGPVAATPIAALSGALTSFTLGRCFIYKATEVPAQRQAWRYALVSGASLGLNTAGEYLFHRILRIEYLLARVVTSIIVSNAWNYPMQRYFVFTSALKNS